MTRRCSTLSAATIKCGQVLGGISWPSMAATVSQYAKLKLKPAGIMYFLLIFLTRQWVRQLSHHKQQPLLGARVVEAGSGEQGVFAHFQWRSLLSRRGCWRRSQKKKNKNAKKTERSKQVNEPVACVAILEPPPQKSTRPTSFVRDCAAGGCSQNQNLWHEFSGNDRNFISFRRGAKLQKLSSTAFRLRVFLLYSLRSSVYSLCAPPTSPHWLSGLVSMLLLLLLLLSTLQKRNHLVKSWSIILYILFLNSNLSSSRKIYICK